MFGRRTIAAALVSTAAAAAAGPAYGRSVPVAVKGGIPSSRQDRLGFSPRARDPRPAVAVGESCGQNPNPPNAQPRPWCTNMNQATPIPMGSGITSVDAAVGANLGVGTVTLNPVEGFTVSSITITTTEPMLLVTQIQAGRNLFLESGSVAADLWQSGGTACKLAEGFNIYPSVGITFTFGNPSNTAANVIVSIMGWPQACPQA